MPKSEDKYVVKVFNWSEAHLSEMTCYKIHTLVLFYNTKTAAKCTKDQEISNCGGVNSPKKQLFGIAAITSKGQTKS